ncbi:SapC family protein [Sphingomonas corticis]|uniref:SapC family protein n=1 Tax=Sphingomonas corticis TaxID=2722791 RepID=A0ABX1CSQ9_9SPHN|nr:SapC family protein [Sphingomonas corticis]
MTRHVRLDNVDHADLRVAIRHGAAFGDAVNQCLVFPTEFEQAQRDFPILFRHDEGAGWYAVALTGLDRDENLFLDGEAWTTRYVPAVQQRGPFAADAAAHDGETPAIHIDLDDSRVGAPDGEPLFLRHGGAAPYLRHIGNVLAALRHGHASAAPTYAALAAHGLLKPVTLDVEIGDGLSYRIDDVHAIDGDRLAALAGAALEELHRSGVLRAATMAAASLDNVARLIELKRRKVAG